MTQSPLSFEAFHDPQSFTITYLVWCEATSKAAIIDPVLDYDHKSGKAGTHSADRVLQNAADKKLQVEFILETHVHADHLSGAPYLKEKTGAPVIIGEHVRDVQTIFRPVFNLHDLKGDGAEFDRLVVDGDTITLGNLTIEVLNTPGHTPACVSYKIDDTIFVGDTLFMPDFGTARCDFPGGDASILYQSMMRLLSYPDETKLMMCHDYKAPGRDVFAWETTVGEQRARNVHLSQCDGADDFIAMREERDAKLSAPALLLPSIQVNIRAGKLPEAEANGVRYLKIPVELG